MDAIEEIKNVVNATKTKPVATPEGAAVAYGSLLAMAVVPILFGSLRSVKFHKTKVASKKVDDSDVERLTGKDAALFPLLASGVLIVLYVIFKVFSKEMINLLITGYFYFLGVLALCHLLSPTINKLIPTSVPQVNYCLKFSEEVVGKVTLLIDYAFTSYDAVSFGLCCIFGLWYLIKKHWIANNLFGIAFAINGVEMLLLNRVTTGLILLGGLFFYDIFWVFYTDVMVTVAKSFEAPIKLVFPQDILEKGTAANNFAMLGLGDIVIPGIFIALLLRFDKSLNRGKNVYFISSFAAYVFGLMTTILFMHWFKHAQPALLYLVPSCLAVPLTLAVFKGDLSALMKYEDFPVKDDDDKIAPTDESTIDSLETSDTTSTDAAKKKTALTAAALSAVENKTK